MDRISKAELAIIGVLGKILSDSAEVEGESNVIELARLMKCVTTPGNRVHISLLIMNIKRESDLKCFCENEGISLLNGWISSYYLGHSTTTQAQLKTLVKALLKVTDTITGKEKWSRYAYLRPTLQRVTDTFDANIRSRAQILIKRLDNSSCIADMKKFLPRKRKKAEEIEKEAKKPLFYSNISAPIPKEKVLSYQPKTFTEEHSVNNDEDALTESLEKDDSVTIIGKKKVEQNDTSMNQSHDDQTESSSKNTGETNVVKNENEDENEDVESHDPNLPAITPYKGPSKGSTSQGPHETKISDHHNEAAFSPTSPEEVEEEKEHEKKLGDLDGESLNFEDTPARRHEPIEVSIAEDEEDDSHASNGTLDYSTAHNALKEENSVSAKDTATKRVVPDVDLDTLVPNRPQNNGLASSSSISGSMDTTSSSTTSTQSQSQSASASASPNSSPTAQKLRPSISDLESKQKRLGHMMGYGQRDPCRFCKRLGSKKCFKCLRCPKCSGRDTCDVSEVRSGKVGEQEKMTTGDRNKQVLGSVMDRAVYQSFQTGDFDSIISLIENGQDVNFQRTQSDNSTALMAAALWGKKDIVHKLLKLGADPNLEDRSGTAAWRFAAKKGFLQLSNDLFQKCKKVEE